MQIASWWESLNLTVQFQFYKLKCTPEEKKRGVLMPNSSDILPSASCMWKPVKGREVQLHVKIQFKVWGGGIRRYCISVEVADNFFMQLQATDQALRCTSRTLLYKMITRKDLTNASDIPRQEDVQTVRDSTYESQQVSWKYYVNSQLRGQSSLSE